MTGFWRGKRVLVTGASGFIGSHLVERLLEEGAIVTGTSRRGNPKFLDGVKDKITLLAGDLVDAGFCARAVHGQDAVFHLAASVGGVQYNMKHPASLFRDNMQPFLNVIEAARLAKTSLFVTVSSACVYPRHCTIPTPENEGFKDFPEETNEGYGMAKRMQEYVSMQYAKEFGMRIAIPRPYNAYGPRDDFEPETSHVIPALIRRVESGENPLVVWGSGNQSRAFLYVDDFVEGILLTAERYPNADPVNIGMDRETTIRELIKTICRVAGKDPQLVFDTTKPEGQPRRNCDTTKMQNVLTWVPRTPLDGGLKKTIEWYNHHATTEAR